MTAVGVVVCDVLVQQPSGMALVENTHMVQQFTAAVADPAIDDAVLPGTAVRAPHRLDSKRSNGRDYLRPGVPVSVKNQMALNISENECL